MATKAEFRKAFKRFVEHPGYSNIDVRAHFDCPNCKANLLLLWSFYPEQFIGLCKKGEPNSGNGGFNFTGIQYYRLPTGEVLQDYEYKTCESKKESATGFKKGRSLELLNSDPE